MKISNLVLNGILLACTVATASSLNAAETKTNAILGAGATFPAPLYQKWFLTYKKENPSVEITYNPIGSGGGIKNLKDQTVDFGASDAPMTDEELKTAKKPILHIPTVMGAVVVSQNLGEMKTPLKLSGDTLAAIFMGTITKWNDPKIVATNTGIKLPDQEIVVVYRADSSGTTNIFTEFLSKVNADWKAKVGAGKSVKWPVGQGNKGNEGVASVIKNTPGAVGYIELVYAEQEHMTVDEIQNKAGKFIKPSIKSVSEAAAGAVSTMPEDFRVSITNADGAGSYPISAFTYILAYQEMGKEKGPELVKLLNWMMDKGQSMAPALFYAPLPKPVLAKVKTKIKSITTK
jgi:phosphate transport system substrate-binding protein